MSANSRVTVLGAGSWGTALALIAAHGGHDVRLWTRDPALAETINRTRHNPRLATAELPENLNANSDLRAALTKSELVVLASPSHVLRDLLNSARTLIEPDALIVSAAKGIETASLMRVSEVAAEVLGPGISSRFVALSGPSFAHEAAAGDPTAVSAASTDGAAAIAVQDAFSFGNFRLYTNDDVIGTELGGAVKNVVAIAAGMVRGLGLGHNSVAALITRGLAEIGRLASQMGGRSETLMGLAGLGDLVLTCTGDLSRNRHVGVELGRGRKLGDITAEMSEVAEGIRTTAAVHELALKHCIEMPITAEVFAVLYENKHVPLAAEALMSRPLRSEF
ncbi:MAG: NAD(P)H-dependent glycerol-3-phosphate dehydrogenase [Pyrinomonadaceae bacterium]